MAPSSAVKTRLREESISKETKRLKRDPLLVACQRLFAYIPSKLNETPHIPTSLQDQTGNNLDRLRDLLDEHDLRTSIISSPRAAVSVYVDSIVNDDPSDVAKEYLVTMLGWHADQAALEKIYAEQCKPVYCLLLFCRRIRQACPKAMADADLVAVIETEEQACCQCADDATRLATLCASAEQQVAQLTQAVVTADPRLRVEQLEHEYQRIVAHNSTFSNALWQLFVDANGLVVKNVYYKVNAANPKYSRLTIFLYDSAVDELVPPRFCFLPSLTILLRHGPEQVVEDMLESFWSHLLRRGYILSPDLRSALAPSLREYFLSGLYAAKDRTIPLALNAHFEPTHPISFYFHGQAGAGKSSLARHFGPVLQNTLEQHLDPELLVRGVKQNLNKPLDTLRLELELRPNNNDLSVMSIIQGRRMTMTQTKPGLVVVDLEEMAPDDVEANPNQLAVAQLLSQRFSGRQGEYKERSAPRNATRRGISGDASIIPLFTSNYGLEEASRQALKKLEMFHNLQCIEMKAVEGAERQQFARAYLRQLLVDHFAILDPSAVAIDLDIPMGEGDTRPLVRHLRMLGFYLAQVATPSVTAIGSIEASIVQRGKQCTITTTGGASIELMVGSMDNLFPKAPRIFDERTQTAVGSLRQTLGDACDYSELATVIDFWLARTLAPAVVVSNDAETIRKLVAAVGAVPGVHCLAGIDAGEYKMMKSLYDPNDTPNLRDDILKFGRQALVAIELQCESIDAQLCVREIVEDTPSMTAFSTEKSALHKSGLFFGVYVQGGITPELRSRASLII